MTALQAFIHNRMRELANEDAALQHKLAINERERAQLRAAAEAAGLHLEPAAVSPEPLPAAVETAVRGYLDAVKDAKARNPRPSERTIKEAVIEILSDFGRGMTALDILSAINTKFGTDYPRTSLSPQLSRLKSEGKIDRDGMVWSLVEPGSEKREAADANLAGGTSTASETDDIF